MRHQRILTFFCLFLGFIGLGACTNKPDPSTTSKPILTIAAGEGTIGLRVKKFAEIYTLRTGKPVEVQAYPNWQYGSVVEGRLLAGTARWGVIYLEGSMMAGLIDDHALSNLAGWLVTGTESWYSIEEFKRGNAVYGLPVDGNVPLYFYRRDRIAEESLDRATTVDGFWAEMKKLSLPSGEYALGAALGDGQLERVLLPYVANNAHSHLWKQDFPTTIDAFCNQKPQSSLAPQSWNWTQADLIEAMTDGKVASGILWADSGKDLLHCGVDGPTCVSGQSLFNYRIFPPGGDMEGKRYPRLANAWVVPAGVEFAGPAEDWIGWVSSPAGQQAWNDLGGISIGRGLIDASANPAFIEQIPELFQKGYPLADFSGPPKIQAVFNQYVHECMAGTLSNAEVVAGFEDELNAWYKQTGQNP